MASDLPAGDAAMSEDEAADRLEQALSRIEAAAERARDVERQVADRLDDLITRVGLALADLAKPSAMDQGAAR